MNIPPLVVSLILAAGAVAAIEWSGRQYEGAQPVRGLAPQVDRAPRTEGPRQPSGGGPGRREEAPREVEPALTAPEPSAEPVEAGPTEAELAAAARRARNLELRREQIVKELHKRSVRIANELGLGTGAELKIAQVFLEEFDEVTAIQAELSTGDRSPEARRRNRERVNEIPRQREERFARLLGPETARKIVEYQDKLAEELGRPEVGAPRDR